MALEKWLSDRVRLAAAEAAAKVNQFALETVADAANEMFAEIWEGFARVGVWALQNPLPIFGAILNKTQFSVLIGMRPNTTFHLGHLTLMRELCWLIQSGGQPIFVFAGHEAGRSITVDDAHSEMVRFGRIYLRFTGIQLPEDSISFADQDCRELQILESHAGRHLSARKVLRLYGWDESISIATLRIPVLTAATFLLPITLFPKLPTLVLSDIHQITHAEATKIIARKLKLPLPSYSYRLLLPSLEGPASRMSVKDPNSLILLAESREHIERKLQRSFSGGWPTPEEQRRYGGDPHRCSFFKIAEILQASDTSTEMYQECVAGALTCKDCKRKHISDLADKVIKLSK